MFQKSRHQFLSGAPKRRPQTCPISLSSGNEEDVDVSLSISMLEKETNNVLQRYGKGKGTYQKRQRLRTTASHHPSSKHQHCLGHGRPSTAYFPKSKSEANIKLRKNVSFWDEKAATSVEAEGCVIEKQQQQQPRPSSSRLFCRRESSGYVAREMSDWACVSFADDAEIIDPSRRENAACVIQRVVRRKGFCSAREPSLFKKDIQRPNKSSGTFPPLHKRASSHSKYISDDASLIGSEEDSDVEEVGNSELFFGEKERLFSADGSTNAQLRKAISIAMNPSRFESISTLLASPNASVSLTPDKVRHRATTTPSLFPSDRGNHMVSCSKLIDKGNTSRARYKRPKTAPVKRGSLALRKVTHQGFNLGLKSTPGGPNEDISRKENQAPQREICFNCWSAGTGKQCMQHQGKDKAKHGDESLLLCKNWDIDMLRRRYRSEEIHEVFTKTATSLRYDKFQKKFQTVVEHKHPIYRLLAKKIEQCNFTSRRKIRVRLWLTSFIDLLRSGSVPGLEENRVSAATSFLHLRNSLANLRVVRELTNEVRHLHPKPPVTGTTLPELCGKVVLLDEHEVLENGIRRTEKLIRVGPTPVPLAFYERKTFELPEPVSFAVDFFSGNIFQGPVDEFVRNLFTHTSMLNVLGNKSRSRGHLCRNYARPRTDAVATLTRRSAISSMKNAGLRAEITIAQSIATDIRSQFGDFRSFDKSKVRPEVTPADTIYPLPIRVDAEMQHYVDRRLHDLHHLRNPLPVKIRTGLHEQFDSDDVKLTRRAKEYGFRVTETVIPPKIHGQIDPKTFVPSQSIASANTPRMQESVVAPADSRHIYPESVPLPVSTLKFIDLLKSHTVCTPGKAQMFTCIGSQKPGKFLHRCDPSLPIGQYTSIACRSWSLVQDNTTADQYYTEDGTPYWYDSQTCQAYWERPLFSEEKIPLQRGGAFFGETSCTRLRGVRAGIRNAMTRKHETDEIKRKRIRVVSRAIGRSGAVPISNSSLGHMSEIETEEEKFEVDDDEESDYCEDVVPAPPCMIPFAVENRSTVPTSERASSQSSKTSLSSCEPEPISMSISETLFSSSTKTPAAATSSSPPSIDPNADAIVDSITSVIGKSLSGITRSEDLLKIGVGLGMSLGAQGMLQLGGDGSKQISQTTDHRLSNSSKLTISSEMSEDQLGEGEGTFDNGGLMEKGESKVNDSEVQSPSNSTSAFAGNSVWEDSHVHPQHTNRSFSMHSVAGVKGKEASKKNAMQVNDVPIETLTEQTPNDFLGIVAATRTGKQHVDYLPYTPNLPSCRPAGRLKPRSVADDWMKIGFDPWSAGREVLRTEFISELMEEDDVLPGERRFSMNLSERSSFAILDGEVIYQRQDNNAVEDGIMAENFELVCSYVRHGKYKELENLINDDGWLLPIDYVDGAGNTLLMISCQNGNKRIAKLCLRRGGTINLQNMNGQTCLHYAFGYGFDDLGDYLISKGADDSIVNVDGLTCYEGLSLDDVAAL
uniref:WW domain-containing protein n=1 Tax=Leptocylindrus danicus TaxID=163516 RepID=A0A7S2KYF9_9STRA|mmetsp:Transcript_28950/g.42523  ORF Transcript_28950/g.42523 Transcript_28950/m.42523 type:complete len:1482 (+) Transcript_28950:131-4576(+)|eukprot:CAMPEP_0116029352 /NCGR_PEP_ID=MMETSP0321-20121206/16091_1 /TAXON_ID=163516 /ORGANISM="Leptocylindrus danicus var. danicus, Strain B650" /LENGTH=1481 /DNA_ID=CAMNT_0003503717 /DNA_START=106 /DNA_END=4551 /DNA_ORIENTATION=+